ncbi:hypothetical protein ACQP2C_19795 [Micromonospora zamorensis]|uniref:hypothetical protein n=1 Tax=Micromonospora zamorensis TaxID=709883 RepID=UPI003D971AB4
MGAWQSIDEHIVQRRIIVAMQAIREAERCSLQEAIDLFAERLEFLRRTRSDDFTVRPEEYGRGVYT